MALSATVFILLSGLCYGASIALCVYGPFSDQAISQDFPSLVNDSLNGFYKSLELSVILIGVLSFVFVSFGVVCMLSSSRWPPILWVYVGITGAVSIGILYVSIFAFLESGDDGVMYISDNLEEDLAQGFEDWCLDPISSNPNTNDKFNSSIDGCPDPGFDDPVAECLPQSEACIIGMRGKITDHQIYIGIAGMVFFFITLVFILLAVYHKLRGMHPRLSGSGAPQLAKDGATAKETQNQIRLMHDEMEKEELLTAVRKTDWDRDHLVELRSIVKYKEQMYKESCAAADLDEKVLALQAAIAALKKPTVEGIEMDSIVGSAVNPDGSLVELEEDPNAIDPSESLAFSLTEVGDNNSFRSAGAPVPYSAPASNVSADLVPIPEDKTLSPDSADAGRAAARGPPRSNSARSAVLREYNNDSGSISPPPAVPAVVPAPPVPAATLSSNSHPSPVPSNSKLLTPDASPAPSKIATATEVSDYSYSYDHEEPAQGYYLNSDRTTTNVFK